MATTDSDQSYQVSLPEFEGPLDLLLHLVKRHELDILDIPISFVTEKYLEYLDLMRALNLDVAGEYLLMAATLAHLKSRELLPRQPEMEAFGEDDEDEPVSSKEELIRRLLEYQRYRDAAEHLGRRPVVGREVFMRGAPSETADQEAPTLAEADTFELLSAFHEALKRARIELSYEVLFDRVSISDRINEVVDVMEHKPTVRFADLLSFRGSPEQVRHHLVVTFLAILEMARLKMIRLLQEQVAGEIYVTRAGDLRLVSDGETSFS